MLRGPWRWIRQSPLIRPSPEQPVQEPQDNGDRHGKAGVADDDVDDSEEPLGMLLWGHAINAGTHSSVVPDAVLASHDRCSPASPPAKTVLTRGFAGFQSTGGLAAAKLPAEHLEVEHPHKWVLTLWRCTVGRRLCSASPVAGSTPAQRRGSSTAIPTAVVRARVMQRLAG
jgi:hypothetical protein